MIKFFFPILFAVIQCQSNLDGTWTCFDTDPIPPDSGIDDPNGDGNFVCTNCVNITPAQCQEWKYDLSSRAYDVFSHLVEASEQLDRAYDDIDDLKSLFSAFSPCPISYHANSGGWSAYGYPFNNVSDLTQVSSNSTFFLNYYLPLWHSTTNYFFCHVEPSIDGSNRSLKFVAQHNSLVGIWTASHEMAMSTNSQLEYPLQKIESSKSYVANSFESVRSLGSSIDSITCETCQLGSGSGGSGSGGSGGEGVDQGCRECYLQYLKSIDSNVDKISANVEIIKDNVGNYTNELLRILRSIDINVAGISNHVARLDDYITDDFRTSVSNIVGSVLVISQQVDSVQRAYYEAFGRSNDHKDKDDQPYTLASMSQAVFDGLSGFDEGEFMKLDWQARQELLLYHMVNPTEATNRIPDVVNDIKASQEQANTTIQSAITELKDSAGAFTRSFNAVQNTIDNLANKLGGSGSPVYEITLIGGGSWLGDEPLTLQISPTVAGFCNALFCAIWYCSAFAFIFYLGVRVFGLFVSVAIYIFKTFTTEL